MMFIEILGYKKMILKNNRVLFKIKKVFKYAKTYSRRNKGF